MGKNAGTKAKSMRKAEVEKLHDIAAEVSNSFRTCNDYKSNVYCSIYKKGNKPFIKGYAMDYDKIIFENAPEDTTETYFDEELTKWDIEGLREDAEKFIHHKLELYFEKREA